jgi:hypothetical protein
MVVHQESPSMIHLKLDLSSPAELEAFGVFCTSVATARRTEPKRPSISDLLYADFGGRKGWAAVDPAKPGGDETVVHQQHADDNEDTIIAAEGLRPETIAAEARAAAPARERGKPSAGHARRTKAEIAEDEAADKATAEGPLNGLGGTTGSDAVAAISTGEERLSPEDTPEDAAADAADEAAESAVAKQASGGKLTVEDVRRTMGLYVNRYGMAAAQVDGQEVFKRVIGESTMVDDKGNARGWRASDLPDDQAVLAKMVSGFEEMTSKNPFNRDVVEKVA